MLRDSGRAVKAPGSMVFAAGSPCCRYNVDVNGFPVEKQADGRWAFFGVASGRRLVGEHDPLALLAGTTGGAAERRALQQAYAAARCVPEAVASRVPGGPSRAARRSRRLRARRRARAAGDVGHAQQLSDPAAVVRPRRARASPAWTSSTGCSLLAGWTPPSWPTGSLRSYYAAQSYGKMQISSVVTDWITVPQSEAQAAQGTSRLGFDANGGSTYVLDRLNATGAVNFAQLDQDRDGLLDSASPSYTPATRPSGALPLLRQPRRERERKQMRDSGLPADVLLVLQAQEGHLVRATPGHNCPSDYTSCPRRPATPGQRAADSFCILCA